MPSYATLSPRMGVAEVFGIRIVNTGRGLSHQCLPQQLYRDGYGCHVRSLASFARNRDSA